MDVSTGNDTDTSVEPTSVEPAHAEPASARQTPEPVTWQPQPHPVMPSLTPTSTSVPTSAPTGEAQPTQMTEPNPPVAPPYNAAYPNYPGYPSYPQPAPYYPQGSSDAWGVPPLPGYPPTTGTSPRGPRRGWLYGGAAVALIALLIAVFAVGHAIGDNNATSPGTTIRNGSPVVSVPASAQDLQQTVINVIHTVQPSVVEVQSRGGQGEAIGSGEVLTKDGYIVTNDHVVDGFSNYTVVLSSGKSLPATLVGTSPQDDLAVLKVAATDLTPISITSSSKVQVGQFAIAIGSPLGLQESATFGIVSALNRPASEGQDGPAQQLTGLIQTSAPINPGNSGGALVDLQGQLIGIPTLGAVDPNSGGVANGIGFAIPSDRVTYVTNQLIKTGKVTSTGQGFIGIRGEDITPQLAAANNLPVQQGVLIGAFANDASGKSPAQVAGVQTGDIITAVDGQSIADSGALASALMSKSPGTQVTLTILRGSSQQQIKVTLGERPTSTQG